MLSEPERAVATSMWGRPARVCFARVASVRGYSRHAKAAVHGDDELLLP